MAALAVVTLSAALLAPHRSRANWVWEWQDIGTARVATLVGGTSMVVVVGLAGVAWCRGGRSNRSVLGAEAVFTALAVGSALVLIRSGTWLPDFRPVMP
jgi:hypothetical protein